MAARPIEEAGHREGAARPCARAPGNARGARPGQMPGRAPPWRAKRPPRAERPILPRPGVAVLSARRGLTSEFGMASGEPPLHGSARGGRSASLRPRSREGPGRAFLPGGPLSRRAPWRLHARGTSDGAPGPRFPPARTGLAPSGCGDGDREELGRLVMLASARRRACSCILSTRWSTWALTRKGAHLGAGFPLRCFQRLSVPDVARRRCRWSTTASPEVRPPRSSRTRGRSPQLPCACGG